MSHQPNAPPAYDDAQKYAAYPDPNAPDHGAAHQYQPNMSNPQHPPPGAPGNAGANTTTYLYVAEGGQTQLGPRPQNTFCSNCRQQVLTKVKYSAGLLTWLLFGGCLLFGCWLGCCLIPFCMDDCQDCEHYCTNCKAFMGQYKRI
uniref:LITAF domain-containing protein n=1 Tax=Globodera rostochiensis TaxID=31243 RepID=A0A914GZD7_GLORO